MKNFLILVLLTSLGFSSNAQIIGSRKAGFSENKRMEYEYNNYAMKDVLFYISTNITMKRVLPKEKDTKYNPKGRVAFENGFPYEYYEYLDGASCYFVKESDDKSRLWMNFGADQEELLEFKLKNGRGNDENKYYYLVVKEDKKIDFLGKEWELITHPEVFLLVKEKRTAKAKIQSTKSKGVKLDGTKRKSLLNKKKN